MKRGAGYVGSGGGVTISPMAKVATKPAGGPLSPMMVVAGTELFLRDQHLEAIKQTPSSETKIRAWGWSAAGTGGGGGGGAGGGVMAFILDEVRTRSMFAPRKLVIVDRGDMLFKKEEEPPAQDGDEEDRRSNRELLEDYSGQAGRIGDPGAGDGILAEKHAPAQGDRQDGRGALGRADQGICRRPMDRAR